MIGISLGVHGHVQKLVFESNHLWEGVSPAEFAFSGYGQLESVKIT